MSVVAESFLNTVGGPAAETGGASLSSSLPFTLGTDTALTFSYKYSNHLLAFSTGSPATAVADYHFTLTLQDRTGATVFTSSPADTNLSATAPPSGADTVGAGTRTVTTQALAAGQYTLILTEMADSFVTPAATGVPEPASLTLLATGALGLLGYGIRRRRQAAP
jgi:hypothetical protein